MAKDRIILFPGLAADERMYAALTQDAATLLTPRLLIPRQGESMEEYAFRHAQWLEIDNEDIVGGCSFGSMVAAEICRQRLTKGLVLLSGALSSHSLVARSSRMQKVIRWFPFCFIKRVLMSSIVLRRIFGEADSSHIQLGRIMINQTPSLLLLRGSALAVNYQTNALVMCPVSSLHGEEDRVISPPEGVDSEIVKHSGHGMVVSHAKEVSKFLFKVCGDRN